MQWFTAGLGLLLFGYGLACAWSPAVLMDAVGMQGPATALTEVRAMYGGVQIGIGAYLIWSAARTARLHQALVVTTFVFTPIALCRAGGLLIDSSASSFHVAALAFECIVAAAALIGAVRIRT